ncbi:unnamed protein product [Clonostachys rosea f. rosea IK726]|uniref:Rhomboid-type serine protease n=2 Tax=Bionectria ochroleuca TaxID=29856 RepID=A0A0B7KEB9_BIOOC|nr:unnamed protein product [Clonostachys rosea f. rosea IK726]
MASNQYYNYDQQHLPPLRNHQSPSPLSNFGQHDAPSPQATPAPSYHSNYPPPGAAPYSSNSHQDLPARSATQSPFATVFDDNAYPANSSSRQDLISTPNDMSSHQQGYYQQDTGYFGAQAESPNQSRNPGSTDAILLQDRPHKHDAESGFNDHIYDAPTRGPSGRKKKGKRKVQLGELGMFGSDKKRIPFVVYIFTIAQVAVFIAELVKMGMLTGTPIMIKPQFNFMIGPSPFVMINMGARYGPCMRPVPEIENWRPTDEDIAKGNRPSVGTLVNFPCPNATTSDNICPLWEACGFNEPARGQPKWGEVVSDLPRQWFRFITPMFMHAGIIHIAFNMLLQLTLARDMEKAIGSIRFFIVYVSSGIFGFVMGGNYGPPVDASTGASGALFGILALTLLDLLYSWKQRKSPVKDLMFILLDVIISFVLGLLPGLDNFAHLGGFLCGLTLGISVLHSPNSLRLKIDNDAAYSTVPGDSEQEAQPFLKNPVGFFKGRKPLWWAWWLIRAGALVLVIVVFIVLINNFYTTRATCSWCKYLSCLPVNNWCDDFKWQ